MNVIEQLLPRERNSKYDATAKELLQNDDPAIFLEPSRRLNLMEQFKLPNVNLREALWAVYVVDWYR